MSQDDDDDGYEPLFDYSNSQAHILVDDDDSDGEDVQIVEKHPCFRPHVTKRGRDEIVKESKLNVDAKEAEEEDWLPPPPKSIKVVRISADGNSMLSELRLRREELVSLTTESTEDMLRKMEESSKKELQKAANSDLNTAGSEALKSSATRKKIVVSVQDDKGSKQFRICVDDKLEKLFKTYAEHIKGQHENLVFCFDGEKLSPSQTAQGLDMEDEDIIEVYPKVG
ncbi:hypothetical protein KI387_010787 [Taxus chinensis]|uniref:Rad60/SUMO-like domain-containing protein n=1 Tax=Taxus chinensis TaxID=29808 RepID=A0AA38FN64_TAXCH|nr:hypothetical protein KI387_010787 [Taxus chinensis]